MKDNNMSSKNYSVFNEKESLFVSFDDKIYKINISKINFILTKILQQQMNIDNKKDLLNIFKEYKLFDDVFLEYVSI